MDLRTCWVQSVFSLDMLYFHNLENITFERTEDTWRCSIPLLEPLYRAPFTYTTVPLQLSLTGQIHHEYVRVRKTVRLTQDEFHPERTPGSTTTRVAFWLECRDNTPALMDWLRAINTLWRIVDRAGRRINVEKLLSDDQHAGTPEMVRFWGVHTEHHGPIVSTVSAY